MDGLTQQAELQGESQARLLHLDLQARTASLGASLKAQSQQVVLQV